MTLTPEALLDGVEPAGWITKWPSIVTGNIEKDIGFQRDESAPASRVEAVYTRAQAIAAVEADRAGRWLPIESAPVDTYVLLCGYLDGPHDPRIKMGYWWSEVGLWSIYGASWKPKFWQPLPTPPSQDTHP